jgi:Uma2 family endonuclease
MLSPRQVLADIRGSDRFGHMGQGSKHDPVSVADYLTAEAVAESRHEYVSGSVYAMAGASNAHNLIAANVLVALTNRLRGSKCRPYNSDTRIRVRVPTGIRFYYPDVSITCRPNPQKDSFQDEPIAVVEVMSPETRRIDEGEKRDAYCSIGSLRVYVLIEQDRPQVVVLRRVDGAFEREVSAGLETSIPLPEVGCDLPLCDVYDGVELAGA